MDLSPQKKSEDYQELRNKYNALLAENDLLKEEIRSLNIKYSTESNLLFDNDNSSIIYEPEQFELNTPKTAILNSFIAQNSAPSEKIQLYLSLFKGRDDVFARRWENKKKETAGYSPACANEWRSGICQKPKISCTDCKNKEYIHLDEKIIEAHLRGQNNLVVGVYPLLQNETCYFLSIDFDDEGWQKDLITLRKVCASFEIPFAVVRQH